MWAAYLARAKRDVRKCRRRKTPAQSPLTLAPGPWPLTPMDFLTQPVGLSHYLAVGTILFVCGVACMTVKRNAVGVLMGIEWS